MKLAIVNNDLGSGGAEKLIYDMSLKLKEDKDIKFDVIILNSKNAVYKEELEKNNIKVISLDSRLGIYNPLHFFRLIKILKNYDVVHGHVFPSQYWVGLAAKFLPKKIKFITTEHNTENGRRGKIFFKYLDRFIYRSYSKVVSISEKTQENLLKWLEIEKINKFIVIENGINLDNFKKKGIIKKEDLGYSNNDKLIIMISRFNKQKDHKTVVSLLSELPQNYKCIFLGEGELIEDIKKYAKEKCVLNRIQFLGYKKNVLDFLKVSDIGIQSSNFEGFGLTTVEIMASGIPLLASNVEGMAQIVKRQELLFERGNVQELKNKILNLESSREYLLNIELGKKRALNYDLNKMLEKYKVIYTKF